MDTKTLIKKLNKVFLDNNQKDSNYAEVRLSPVDFGGLYYSNKFVLHVKAEHQIDDRYEEIRKVLELLDKNAKDELECIWRVAVYDTNEDLNCESEDIIIYPIENVCA